MDGFAAIASVYTSVSAKDKETHLPHVLKKVVEARGDMEKQITRRRDFERQLRESRKYKDKLSDQLFVLESSVDAATERIKHVKDQLEFLGVQTEGAEGDIKLLREKSTVPFEEPANGLVSHSEERQRVIDHLQGERVLLDNDQVQIERARKRLEDLYIKKVEATRLQKQLLERKRQVTQDRSLILHAIDTEREELARIRADRIKMSEERNYLQHAMADITRERLMARHRGFEKGPGDSSLAGTPGYKVQTPGSRGPA
jgi:chromosome segregation ATPase